MQFAVHLHAAQPCEHGLHECDVDGVVFDVEHALDGRGAAGSGRRACGLSVNVGMHAGQIDPEAAAAAAAALHADLAAHGVHQPPAQRQADAGARYARGFGIAALEGREQALLLGGREAGAAVVHEDAHALAFGAAVQGQLTAGLVELDGVAQQVEQHLLEAHGVDHDLMRKGLLGHRGYGDAALLRQRLHQVQTLQHHGQQRHGRALDGELARGDAAEVEHVVDELEQMARAAHDLFGLAALARGQRVLLVVAQQLRKTEHGVERRAQFVRHVREELRLGAVRTLGFVARGDEALFGAAAVADVDAEAVVTRPAGHAVDAAGHGDLHRELADAAVEHHGLAVQRQCGELAHGASALDAQHLVDRAADHIARGATEDGAEAVVDEAIDQRLVEHGDEAGKRIQHGAHLGLAVAHALHGLRLGGDVAKAPHAHRRFAQRRRDTAAQDDAAIEQRDLVVAREALGDGLERAFAHLLRIDEQRADVVEDLRRGEPAIAGQGDAPHLQCALVDEAHRLVGVVAVDDEDGVARGFERVAQCGQAVGQGFLVGHVGRDVVRHDDHTTHTGLVFAEG